MKRLQKFLLGVFSVAFCMSAVALFSENTKTVSVSADAVSSWEMVDGASIRTAAPSGIRFTARISEADYAALTANDADVSFGMVIMPYSYVAEYGDADTVFNADTKYTFSETDTTKVRVLHDSVTELKTKKGGYYYFNAALTNIAEGNYEKEFYARAYYSDGTNYYFTPDNGTDNVRSVSYVAARALSDTTVNYSASVKARLTQYATQYKVSSDGSNIKLSGNYGSVTSVSIDGSAINTGAEGGTNIVYYPQEDKTLVLTSVPLGKHTAVIENTAGEVFTVPFYRASYVVRTVADLTAMAVKQVELGTGSNVYIVVAQNIDYNNAEYTPATTTFSGTFDGNGHTISNLVVKGRAFLTTGSLGGAVKNIMMDNLTFKTDSISGGFAVTAGANAKFENVFMRGTNAGTTTGGLLATTLTVKSGATSSGYAKNCIVIDRANYACGDGAAPKSALGRLSKVPTTSGTGSYDLANTLVVSTGTGITCNVDKKDYTSSFEITQVASEEAITATQLSAFATAAGAESGWLYDATTGELSLLGNVVFTVSPNSDL